MRVGGVRGGIANGVDSSVWLAYDRIMMPDLPLPDHRDARDWAYLIEKRDATDDDDDRQIIDHELFLADHHCDPPSSYDALTFVCTKPDPSFHPAMLLLRPAVGG
jgi:hypothetical protein